MSRILRAFASGCLLLLALVAPTAAAQPTMERIDIADVGIHQDEVSDACGFDVWFDASGHFILRTLIDGNGDPVRDLNNYSIHIQYYSAYGSVDVVDVGPDRITYLADGSLLLRITGSVESITAPGEGRVYSDVGVTTLLITFDDQGNASVEFVSAVGQHWGDEIEVLCDLLGPA
jgi:hypothetical protein